ncbi:MAG TPA: SOS response-associated peptidase family protein [Puia sp.]|nr:SOS response-associated peptidase family protein [Puia sp.]
MCYYNGIKVTKAEYNRLKELERQVAFLNEDFAIHKGFDFLDFPIIRPLSGSHETERVDAEWGFLPPYLKTREDVKKFRSGYKDDKGFYHKGYPCLNATSEELLNKIYRDAALHRRCLVPSAGFYEWRHVQVVGKSGKLLKTPEKYPYLIQMRNQPEFYMAGVWNPWTDPETKKTIATFSIVTTVANTLMKQIHNSKERMPTILPGDLAEAWLYNDLTDQDILDIANYQAASIDMKATALNKDFLKRENPHDEVIYPEVPELVYS